MDGKRDSLFRNYVYNFSSQILGIILPLITAPYLARILKETGNGQIAFANSVVAYFVSFAGFGFSLYGQREIAKYRDDAGMVNRIFTELFLIKVVFGTFAMIALIALVVSPFIIEQYKLLVMINSLQIISTIFDIQFYYQGKEDFKSIAIRTIIIRLISIICVFLFVRDQGDVWKYLLYSSSVGLFANLIMWPRAFKKITLVKVNAANLKRHIKPAFYVFLPMLSGTIFSVLDLTMIGYLAMNPEYENGCYGSAMKLINIISVVIMADGQVFASRNASDFVKKNYKSIEKHIGLGFRYVWFIGLPIMAGLFVLSGRISRWFFGSGFEKVPVLLKIFTVRVITHGIMNVIGNQYLLPTGREKVCTVTNFCGIAANTILNALLIPKHGCIGAAIASIVAEAVLILLYIIYFIAERKYWSISIIFHSKNYILASIMMFVLIYCLNNKLDEGFGSLCLTVMSGIIVYGISLLALRDDVTINYLKKLLLKLKGNNTDAV